MCAIYSSSSELLVLEYMYIAYIAYILIYNLNVNYSNNDGTNPACCIFSAVGCHATNRYTITPAI